MTSFVLDLNDFSALMFFDKIGFSLEIDYVPISSLFFLVSFISLFSEKMCY